MALYVSNRNAGGDLKQTHIRAGSRKGQQVKTCGAGPIPARRITGKIKNIIPDTRRKDT